MVRLGEYQVYEDLPIARGGNCTIFECLHVPTNVCYAAKVVNISETSAHFEKEVSFLRRLSACEYIIQLQHAYTFDDYGIMIFPKYPFDLLTVLNTEGEQVLSMEIRYSIFRVLCEATRYLHDHGYVHLDLKPENVLLSADFTQVIICDLGCSRKLNSKSSKVRNHLGGTLEYSPPEVCKEKSKVNGKKVDIWGLGIIYHILFTFKFPFAKSKNLKSEISNGNITIAGDSLSVPQRNFVSKMLHVKHTKRCNIHSLINNLNILLEEFNVTPVPVLRSRSRRRTLAKLRRSLLRQHTSL